jgi:hypothetical protein
MSKFTDHLWQDLAQEHGPTLARAGRPEPGRAGGPRLLRRPRVLAGSSLGLAGVGVALVLVLGAGGAAAPPAFAVTKQDNGSVLVKLNYQTNQNLPQVNARLAAMGTGESITIYDTTGAATVSGPVTCTPAPGVSGPQVKVLEGSDGTQVIGAGQSAGNTAEGTFHLDRCVTSEAGSGSSGNSGNS